MADNSENSWNSKFGSSDKDMTGEQFSQNNTKEKAQDETGDKTQNMTEALKGQTNYAVRFSASEQLLDFGLRIDGPSWMNETSEVAKRVSDLVNTVLSDEGIKGNIEVSITFVTRMEIEELNRDYRGIDSPTDVLSFECDDPSKADSDLIVLGDVIVSPEVAYDQSDIYGTSFLEEMRMLITHGMLHLLGYDHIEDEDAKEMQERELELKKAWENRK